MARSKRLVLPGLPHHVTNRGNRRLEVFVDDEDYHVYLSRLEDYSNRYETQVYTYCLMPNHTHTICVPSARDSLSRLFHDLQGKYSSYFNRKHGFCGHLWQQRFFSCPMDNTHLWNAVRYVERNPVRANLVGSPELYRWSSAPAHCGLREESILTPDFPPRGLVTDWSSWLKGELSQEELAAIRIATLKGIPYASEAFIRELEALLGVRIRPRK